MKSETLSLIKIEYWDAGDIVDFAYSTGYKNAIYLNCILEHNEYPYTEEGVEDGDREFIATFQKIGRDTITSNFVVTPHQRQALMKIQIHNFVNIWIDGVMYENVKYFKVIEDSILEVKDFYQLRLKFQTKYGVNRSKKDNIPVFDKTGIVAGGLAKKIVSEITDIPANVTGEIYHGRRVIFSGLSNRGIREYDSTTAQWIVKSEKQENAFVVNADDDLIYYYDGLDWRVNSKIDSISLKSGSTYTVKGFSRVGYIELQSSSDGGTTWDELAQITSGEFKVGYDVTLTGGIDSVRAVYYVHGGYTEITSEAVVNPAAVEYLDIIQSLTAFESEIGNYSDSQNFTIEGTGSESTDVEITAPAGFEVSADEATWLSELTITYIGGIPLTTIYVRMSKETSGGVSGNISLEVDDKIYNVAVSGEVLCSITWIPDYLDLINGEVIEENIEDKLDYLTETKSQISQAITDNGGDGSGTFRSFADEIADISCIWETFEF